MSSDRFQFTPPILADLPRFSPSSLRDHHLPVPSPRLHVISSSLVYCYRPDPEPPLSFLWGIRNRDFIASLRACNGQAVRFYPPAGARRALPPPCRPPAITKLAPISFLRASSSSSSSSSPSSTFRDSPAPDYYVIYANIGPLFPVYFLYIEY